MKRTVFLVVALFALMAVGVYAQTEADFEVVKSKDGKSITIDGYKGSATAVNIPAKIQNLPVTVIDENAFVNKKKITSVTIPNGVTSIGQMAFSGCTGLTGALTIPNSVTSIASGAFYNCTGLTSVIFTATSKVTSIGQEAFRNWTSLTSVTIPNSVTSLGISSFSGCTKLANVIIGSGVTSIQANAFRNCDSLTSVTFSGSIPSSGFHDDAFSELGDIRAKYLAAGGGAGTYTRPNGTATTWTKGGSATAAPAAGTPELAFKLKSDGKSYTVSKQRPLSDLPVIIPATYNNLPVTTIDNMAFSECVMISNVTIPASVTMIELQAFYNCVSLKSVTFGGAKTTFGWTDFPNGRDLRTKYEAGGAGTYTLSNDGKTWTKK
jgi:hypothetical protein